MKYVFNTEGDNEILGPFYREDEGVVEYEVPGGAARRAPADCVTVREVTRAEIVQQFEHFASRIRDAEGWIVGGGYGDTGLNSLVGAAAEMVEYASVMGAALTFEAARTEVQRTVRDEKCYRGPRAHSRQFEEAEADEAFRMAQGLEAE